MVLSPTASAMCQILWLISNTIPVCDNICSFLFALSRTISASWFASQLLTDSIERACVAIAIEVVSIRDELLQLSDSFCPRMN